MENKKFKLWNRIVAGIILLIASITYVSTIEPSASFWDCGEFIASSYKLEVGHPPGNPVFQLFARFFSMFASPEHAAIAVNILSAMCSAFTIMLLYLTIVFFAKRLVDRKGKDTYTQAQAVSIFGSAAVGALAYCFSDTFWFSAVEGEVYAMSSLFTALVFWAMTKWYDEADQPHANRWIILICFLMGLSIGVHLLNLLAIPAIVFLYFYKKREDGKYTFKDIIGIGLLSLAILFVILFLIIPYLPKICAYMDLFFVNTLGLPYNSGAIFFMLALLAACFWGIFTTYKRGKVIWNTVLLGFTTIVIGFSTFSIVVIRSNVMTPTNEYQPDNAFTLVRYLSREQYGSTPLLYGQYFDAPADITTGKYWAPLNGKYKHVDSPAEAKYLPQGKMLFPRMWNGMSDNYIQVYLNYMDGKGTPVPGATHKKPTFGTNLKFFLDYQLNWMYWRYFMWNFAGRQNDIHSPVPGNNFYGNWESGIPFLDQIRLGDQNMAPAPLKENKGKNHYFLLPLLLGILGLCFQFDKDKRGFWVTFLMFFMTGIAIVIYLNQPPMQVRERDYAYAGSFYTFAMWIGFAALALFNWFSKQQEGKRAAATASLLVAGCLFVPGLMARQNWDDHDRSNRKTAVEMATNYLNSVGENGILITHGDNDTFPLWYAQEVEGIRTDVRICNTSLLGTDWHINQMKYACNQSQPLDLSIGEEQYLYGTNDYVPIIDDRDKVYPLSEVMTVFKKFRRELQDGRKICYIASRKFSIPVNKENVIRHGILPAEFKDMIPDEIVLTIPKNKNYISKPELFMLDFLSNYQWDRPLHVLSYGGDINIGLKEYLMYDGFSCHFIPLKNKVSDPDHSLVDVNDLYRKMTQAYSWNQVSRNDYFVDYQNLYTFIGVIPQREIFLNTSIILDRAGQKKEAIEMLDKAMEVLPADKYPYESICLGFYNNDITIVSIIEQYLHLGEKEKALKIADQLGAELLKSVAFFTEFFYAGEMQFKECCNILYYLSDMLEHAGESEKSKKLMTDLEQIVKVASEG